MVSFKLALFILVKIALVSCKSCKDGPSYWCTNKRTAEECGALNLCGFSQQLDDGPKQFLDGAPVNVTLYYEALCPDCREVILDQVVPTVEKLASSGILNMKFVPYGNARQTPYGNQWIFYCQHGPSECQGNLIESCALYHYPDQNQNIKFINCMEYYGPTTANLNYCASLAKMDVNEINSCVNSEEGNKIEHLMGVETDSLSPAHQYVPWFTMNGYHTDDIQNDLSTNMLYYVCQSYTGTKPAACNMTKKKILGCPKDNNEY